LFLRLAPLLLITLALALPVDGAATATGTKKKPAASTPVKKKKKPVAVAAAPKPAPPAPAADTAADTVNAIVRIVDFIAHPALQVVTWPVQNVLAPGVEFLTYPAQPPIRYFLEENVIDRTTGLFRFGPGGDLSIYPSISLAAGTSSRTGVVARHESPFGRDSERLVAYFQYYVNGDYRMRSFLTARDLLGTPLQGKVAFGLNRLENTLFYQPDDNTPYSHSTASETYESQLDYPLWFELYLRGGFTLRYNRFGEAPPALAGQGGSDLTSEFFSAGEDCQDLDDGGDGTCRGLHQSFLDRIWLIGFVRDTRNNENIPVDGTRLETGWYYHDADRNHDYQEWRGRYSIYFKLGPERYEITAAEERRRGGASLNRWLKDIEYEKIRQQIFSRKVLVLQVYGAQSFEVPGNRMPLYGMQALGNGTPLRAYPGSRYRNYAVAATSAEYRFPILRIMDGTLFNEYGMFGRSLDALDPVDNLRNSWGFGVRVREPDMFLFRIEVAFHGISGAVLNVNADTPF
jgi:hypothetical protein